MKLLLNSISVHLDVIVKSIHTPLQLGEQYSREGTCNYIDYSQSIDEKVSYFIFTLHLSNLCGLREINMKTEYFAHIVKNRMVSTVCYNWENIIQ